MLLTSLIKIHLVCTSQNGTVWGYEGTHWKSWNSINSCLIILSAPCHPFSFIFHFSFTVTWRNTLLNTCLDLPCLSSKAGLALCSCTSVCLWQIKSKWSDAGKSALWQTIHPNCVIGSQWFLWEIPSLVKDKGCHGGVHYSSKKVFLSLAFEISRCAYILKCSHRLKVYQLNNAPEAQHLIQFTTLCLFGQRL